MHEATFYYLNVTENRTVSALVPRVRGERMLRFVGLAGRGVLVLFGLASGAALGYLITGHWIPSVASGGSKPDFGRLAVVAAVSGVVAWAVLEFVKKMSGLSTRFNRSAVQAWFGLWERDFDSAVPVIITYDGTIRQIASQVSQFLRDQSQALVVSNSEADDNARVRRNLGRFWRALPAEVFYQISDEGSVATIYGYIERRVDAFQIATTARWYLFLRAMSAVIASVLSALGAWATSASFAAIVIGLLLGLVFGGPVAWTTRDLVRLVERGARR